MKGSFNTLLRVAAFVLLTAAASGCEPDSQPIYPLNALPADSALTLAVTTDLHYLPSGLQDNGPAFQRFLQKGDGKRLEYSDPLTDAWIEEIRSARPDAVILSGDLTNNGERASHRKLAEKLGRIEAAGSRVYVIPGNHDINNPWASGFRGDVQYRTEGVDAEEFRRIYASYGYDEAVSRDTKTLSYLATPSASLWLLMLDTSRYDNNYRQGYPQTDGELPESTLRWISKCADEARRQGARLLPVMHHNLLDHNSVIRKGYTLNNSGKAVSLFSRIGVTAVFSGHIHIQDINTIAVQGNTIADIASNALSVYPHQYGRVTVSKEGSFRYSTVKLQVGRYANKMGSRDDRLLQFETYSRERFMALSDRLYERAASEERSLADLPQEEQQRLTKTMALLNLHYFAGTENTGAREIAGINGDQLLDGLHEGFLRSYLNGIRSDNTEDNELELQLPVIQALPED